MYYVLCNLSVVEKLCPKKFPVTARHFLLWFGFLVNSLFSKKGSFSAYQGYCHIQVEFADYLLLNKIILD